jgi:uncharacterized protein DUF4850
MKTLLIGTIALFVTSCNTSTPVNKTQVRTADTAKAIVEAKIELKTIVLKTDDGILEDSEVNAFKYPASLIVDSAGNWGDKLAAFGAAYQLWLGLNGWAGKGAAGADGNVAVNLFPSGGDDAPGPCIVYYEAPACVGCVLSSAAQYFPEAMKEYNAEYNQDSTDPIRIPNGIQVRKISANIIIYTLPTKNGLLTQGVACYNGLENYSEAKFVLPTEQSELSDFLVKYYIAHLKQ